MPLNREDHEKLLADLLNPELEQASKTDILTQLRDNYTGFTTEHETVVQTNEKLKNDNADLVVANSRLFRQTGITGEGTVKKEDEKKTFSESITIERFEGRK